MIKRDTRQNYFLSKDKRKEVKDVYVLAIPDSSFSYGYKRIYFHAPTKTAAGLKAKELFDEYQASKKKKNEPKKAHSKPVYVKDACKIFITRRETGRKDTCQEHSITQVSSRFRNHLLPFLGKKKLADVSVEDIFAYKEYLVEKDLADKTINYIIDEAKEFFSYCVEVGWMSRTPFDSTFKMAKPKPKKHRVPGNLNDYRKMLQKGWSNPVNHSIALVCFFTGMRVSEIRALKKDDFELFYNHEESEDCVVIHIRHSLTNKNVEKSPKNGRTRLTVVPRWLYEFIAPVIEFSQTELAFSNTRGVKPVSIDKNLSNFRRELAAVTGMTSEEIRAAGIDFHSLRAMFNSVMTGVLASDIRRGILGWTSENIALEHYFTVLPIHYQKILDAQKSLLDEESIRWFRKNNILELSEAEYESRSRRNA